jgi:hypothetical protein
MKTTLIAVLVALVWAAPAAATTRSVASAATATSSAFQDCFELSVPGDICEVGNGTYPEQQMHKDANVTRSNPSATVADVTFQPASGATVTLRGLSGGDLANTGTDGPWHVTFKSMGMEVVNYSGCSGFGCYVGTDLRRSRDITFSLMKLRGFNLYGVKDFQMLGGEAGRNDTGSPVVGSGYSGGHVWSSSNSGSTVKAENILFKGVWFHGVHNAPGGGHVAGLDVGGVGTAGVDGFSLKNSRFSDIEDESLKISKNASTDIVTDILIENNIFYACDGQGIQYFDGDHGLVQNNSFDSTCGGAFTRPDNGQGVGAKVDVTVANNVFPRTGACNAWSPGEVTYYNNLWTSTATSACGTGDFAGTQPSWDANLVPPTNANVVNAGNTTIFSATDKAGVSRPLGAAPDIGAYEVA